MAISLFFSVQRLLVHYSGRALLGQLVWLGVGTILAGLIGYFSVGFLSRRVLQDLYGQHLDHLQAVLRELSEADVEE